MKFFKTKDEYIAIHNFLNKLYAYVFFKFPKLQKIILPEKLEADPFHKWGLGEQHFVRTVYRWLGKRIDEIISKKLS